MLQVVPISFGYVVHVDVGFGPFVQGSSIKVILVASDLFPFNAYWKKRDFGLYVCQEVGVCLGRIERPSCRCGKHSLFSVKANHHGTFLDIVNCTNGRDGHEQARNTG